MIMLGLVVGHFFIEHIVNEIVPRLKHFPADIIIDWSPDYITLDGLWSHEAGKLVRELCF